MSVTFEATSNVLLTGGAANTKGSYVQLAASTAAAADLLYVYFGVAAAAKSYLIDIAVGGAGSEVVHIPNILYQSTGGAASLDNAWAVFPVNIPAGSRVAARMQESTGSQTMEVEVVLVNIGGLSRTPTNATSGVSTTTSQGTNLDPGGTADTKGAWTELVTSTAARTKWLTVYFGNNLNTVATTAVWYVDIGTGAAASEAVYIPDIRVRVNSTGDKFEPFVVQFPVDIAAGTRIAARASCSTIDATDRLIDIAVTTSTEDLGVSGARATQLIGV